MKKIIITGATGFIGGALAKKLLSEGNIVYGIDINADKLDEMKQYGSFVPIVADFSMYDRLEELINDRTFDLCIHTAWKGMIGGKDLYDHILQNESVKASCRLCEACATIGVKRFIFCGSSYQEMVSKDLLLPTNYYGIAKKFAASYCLAISAREGMECNIAILTNTYGPGDRSQKAVNTFIRKLLAQEPLDLIDGYNRNDWCYIDDTVAGILATAESRQSYKEYYIGHVDISRFRDKLIQMKEVLGSNSELRFGKFIDNTFVDYDRINLSALENDTGFKCETDFKKSILLTAEWIKKLDNIRS